VIGIDTTAVEIPFPSSIFWVSTAIPTSDPVDIIVTLGVLSEASLITYPPLAVRFSLYYVLRSGRPCLLKAIRDGVPVDSIAIFQHSAVSTVSHGLIE